LSIVHLKGVRSVTFPLNPNESQPASRELPQQPNPHTQPLPFPYGQALPAPAFGDVMMPPKPESRFSAVPPPVEAAALPWEFPKSKGLA
jgi:hypothetical protein